MALVAYSDSEGSDNEAPAPAPVPAKLAISKTQPGKLKVELPALRSEPGQKDGDTDAPPAKRARTAGAFGGFNSLLPAPKRPAAQASGLKKGVSLKTSSEAAFSRAPPPASDENEQGGQSGANDDYDEFGNRRSGSGLNTSSAAPKEETEVKLVGKATRFMPLSVVNNRKKAMKKAKAMEQPPIEKDVAAEKKAHVPAEAAPENPPAPKPKKSLFSLQQDDDLPVEDDASETYKAPKINTEARPQPDVASERPASSVPTNSLDAVAADLNLTPAQRRQLFGRNAKDVNVTHFNLDNEYRANEQLRAAGETVEHKAVKSIAPGKHSLQQLVNNARTNQESIEDKWAEGRRARGGGR
jgi:hypothetical protein